MSLNIEPGMDDIGLGWVEFISGVGETKAKYTSSGVSLKKEKYQNSGVRAVELPSHFMMHSFGVGVCSYLPDALCHRTRRT